MNLLFTSAALDSSGYAEASRNYLCALSKIPDINLFCRTVSFEHWKTDMGKEQKDILDSISTTPTSLDTHIIHLTPENFARQKIRGVKNIGYTVWETTKLPDQWVQMCNNLDEIWVPSQWNVNVFKESGVTVPVKKIPHAFSPTSFQQNSPMERSFAIPGDRYNFYSVFQWSERKNPSALLQAYLTEFKYDDPVCLVLKTYLRDNTLADGEQVKLMIAEVKKRLWLTETPPIVLIHDALSRDEMLGLHQECDCFVLPHRAEGWGIPHFESMAAGNPTIATGYSGNLEFMNEKNSLLVECNETPCFGMDRPTYNGKMMWAEPHIDHLKMQMRHAFEGNLNDCDPQPDRFEEDPRDVLKKFNWETVGSLMAKELGL